MGVSSFPKGPSMAHLTIAVGCNWVKTGDVLSVNGFPLGSFPSVSD